MTGAREVALLCALLLLAYARAPVQAYNVDCNHEFIDCETELSKTTSDDEDLPSPKISSAVIESSIETEVTSSIPPTPEIIGTTKIIKSEESIQEVTEKAVKPKPRLLNINVDELQNFANALHNQTKSLEKNSKKELDLSDINLDDDDDDDLPRIGVETKPKISDKLYSNSQASSHSVLPNKGSEGIKTCKEDGISYKIGQHVDRGCEETCECVQGGAFHCSPRCKHPYVRRGRRLDDPLCFESPVDECCSIIACATGTGDAKVPKLEVCRYGNDTHTVGSKWHVGCEQTCVCEPNSAVTCTPRCKPLIPSEKCINVQDPNDVCCEVQVCDVSQDVHEEPAENVTNSTLTSSTTSEPMTVFEDYDDTPKFPMRPLVLTEPIGSIKVLHNNSVQVNLMHINNTEDPIHLQLSDDGGKTFKDVELKYSNLILNLDGGKDYILKTKETGTKFNFTITSSDVGANEVSDDNVTKVGCYHDGQYYAVGEEFRIGCSELCECTGPDMHECAALICPNHVGLELVSKGCVRWAPNPPPQPPNCCPRTARCLSDGTCHYKGIAVPNWSEVPISLTGCEQRCFCENGELDCQEVCSPLPAIPPQTLRCPPMHRPAPVNISDEDCCKQWGCLPNIADSDTSISNVFSMPEYDESEIKNFVTPIAPLLVTTITVIPAPSMSTPSLEFYKKINSIKPITKIFKTTDISKYIDKSNNSANNNITVFKFHDIDTPLKIIQPEPSLFNHHENWKLPTEGQNKAILLEPLKKTHTSINQATHSHLDTKLNFHFLKKLPQTKNLHLLNQEIQDPNGLDKKLIKPPHDFVTRVPISHVDHTNVYLPTRNNFFTPTKNSNLNSEIKYHHYSQLPARTIPTSTPNSLFIPVNDYKTSSDCNKLFKHTQCSINYDISKIKHIPHVTQINQLNIIKNKELNPVRKIIDDKWKKETKIHLLVEEPNPYETVLLRPLPSPDSSSIRKTELTAGPKYSSLDFERLLSQMEVESEINRNQERSADKSKADAVAGASLDFPSHPKQPPFLPTPPPEIYPQDDIPDYDQNNIHRPLEPSLHGLPPGLTIPPNYSEDNKKLIVISLVADSPTSVKMLFGLPPVLVGLRGSVDLRYTDKFDDDISHWHSQVFAPADEVLTTPRLEFRLTGLRPSTLYKIRGKLFLHNLPVEPESEIYTIRTLDLPTISPIEEKRREIDSRLTVVDVNDTSAHVSWRHFNEDELQFIDGIQVRYRPIGTPIYSMTELLHHSRSAADLHDLRPGSRYEASLVLVPPPRSATELHDPGRIEFTTSPYADPYNWSVVVEARAVGSEAAELTWRGVPSPAERWVRVYRAAHACGPPGVGTRREHDAFRLAARDQPPSITLTGLEPNTRCRVWLELFLTNGKVKTSNVLEINTKSQDEPEPIDNEIEASSIAGSRGAHHGDYYGALVVVGVVAALGALTSLLLLLVVVRRYRPRSVPITPVPTAPRESSLPPYDNPAYKLELQQETMDL